MLTFLWYVAWFVFAVSALLLVVFILLQESKGGGLSEAFGGAGAETFGVKSGGVNRFTFLLAGLFIASAFWINYTWNM